MTIHDCTHARYKIHGIEHYLWGMSTWLYMIVQFTHAWIHDYMYMIVHMKDTRYMAVSTIWCMNTWLYMIVHTPTCMMQDTWQWALWHKTVSRKKLAHLHSFEPLLVGPESTWNMKRQKLILGSYVDPCIGYEGADPEICEQLVPPKWHHRGRDGEVLSEGKRTSVINISDTIVCWPLTLKRVCGCPVMAVTCPSHWTKPQRT